MRWMQEKSGNVKARRDRQCLVEQRRWGDDGGEAVR